MSLFSKKPIKEKEEENEDKGLVTYVNNEAIADLQREVIAAIPKMNQIFRLIPFTSFEELLSHKRKAKEIVEDLFSKRVPGLQVLKQSNDKLSFKLPSDLAELQKNLQEVTPSYRFSKLDGDTWGIDQEALDIFCQKEYQWIITTPYQHEAYKLQQAICNFLNARSEEEKMNLFGGYIPNALIWKLITLERPNSIGADCGKYVPRYQFPFEDWSKDLDAPREFEPIRYQPSFGGLIPNAAVGETVLESSKKNGKSFLMSDKPQPAGEIQRDNY